MNYETQEEFEHFENGEETMIGEMERQAKIVEESHQNDEVLIKEINGEVSEEEKRDIMDISHIQRKALLMGSNELQTNF